MPEENKETSPPATDKKKNPPDTPQGEKRGCFLNFLCSKKTSNYFVAISNVVLASVAFHSSLNSKKSTKIAGKALEILSDAQHIIKNINRDIEILEISSENNRKINFERLSNEYTFKFEKQDYLCFKVISYGIQKNYRLILTTKENNCSAHSEDFETIETGQQKEVKIFTKADCFDNDNNEYHYKVRIVPIPDTKRGN